jgi:ATP/maltotriose-dependent transcriptional regulator MalT
MSGRSSVSRTALVNRLRAAGAFPTVIVVAPAGYGKTTVLAQWAAKDARPFAWLSIDERATTIQLFCCGILPRLSIRSIRSSRRLVEALGSEQALGLGCGHAPTRGAFGIR